MERGRRLCLVRAKCIYLHRRCWWRTFTSSPVKCMVRDEALNLGLRVWKCAPGWGMSKSSSGGDRWVWNTGGMMISGANVLVSGSYVKSPGIEAGPSLLSYQLLSTFVFHLYKRAVMFSGNLIFAFLERRFTMNYEPVGLRDLGRPRSRWHDQFCISERAIRSRTLIMKEKKNKEFSEIYPLTDYK